MNEPLRQGGGSQARADRVDVVATYEEQPTGRLKLPFVTAPYSTMAAAFRTLRHRVQALEDARVIAVTSAEPEEGKTTCALNLAMALAEHGMDNVLVVEANFQRPAIAGALGFAPPVSFAQQAERSFEQASIVWQAVATYFENLHVLALDPTDGDRSPLKGAVFSAAMASLRRTSYPRIIVDCPPITGSPEMTVIQDLVDGLLLTARGGITRASRMRKAADQLQPVTIFGTVLLES